MKHPLNEKQWYLFNMKDILVKEEKCVVERQSLNKIVKRQTNEHFSF